MFLDQIVSVEFAAFFEQQNGRGCELFGHRPDTESRIDGIWNLPSQVSEAVRLVEDDGAVLRHEHGAHETVVAGEIFHYLIDAIRVLGGERPRNEREHNGDPE
jgi:hypothetical protein